MNAVDLIVEDDAWSSLQGKTRLAEEAIRAACAELPDRAPGVVAVLLGSDAAIAAMNVQFRGKDGPTNVLSFPSGEHADNHLGDIALAHGVVAREAAARAIDPADHLRHLIIHGFLHLQGYDHQGDDEAELMEMIERRALARLGVADPYANEDSGSDPHAE
ncbi:rRNA maturation factor [Maricaulis sp. W15]|uniref:Endoribonuclease YbeY n=1 Tax=Maricaulis maris TaxID=74318 RepID=A0A495D4G9_9PROT|nr:MULTISPECIES: rRNA maturation RNase YbeY [Maricaulis]OLF75501.1 rRNA maturation factor [Maricaulis sp. W15]RKQ96806.1 putative rRNA maturation factor [Maricaulis maris]